MPSANDFATRAFQLLGVIDATDTPSSEDAQLALNVLNDWIDGLGTQRLTIYYRARTTGIYTANAASITLGSGGTFDLVRPLWIEAAAYVVPSSSPAIEVPIPVWNDQEYAAQRVKAQTSSLFQAIWIDFNWTAGLARIFAWPVPTQAITLVLYTPVALTQFATLSTNYTFPPGYRRAITFNLANELAPWYPSAQPDPRVAQIATDSLANIKRVNARIPLAVFDPTLIALAGRRRSGIFNYRTGT